MNIHDFQNCPGNLCMTDPDRYSSIWYSDEAICSYSPRPKWLRIQARLHRLFLKGKLKNPYTYFTLKMLEKRHAIHPSTEGIIPDSETERNIYRRLVERERLSNINARV